MGMTVDGHMLGCPMMAETAVVCNMDLVEHIQIWEGMTVSVIQELAPLLVLVALVFYSATRITYSTHVPTNQFKVRRRDVPVWLLFDALKQALSSGILHPKIFPARSR